MIDGVRKVSAIGTATAPATVADLKRALSATAIYQCDVPAHRVASVGWFGLSAPAHTPAEIVNKLNKAVVAIMATQGVKDRMTAIGAELEPQTPDKFGRYINADIAKWTKLVKEENIVITGSGK